MDVLARIIELRDARNWTEYQLAEKSGMAQSTISSWYRKRMLPTISSLEKICNAFGITLSQFFMDDNDEMVNLTHEQLKLIEYSMKLNKEQFQALLLLLETL
jgi:transcriptional regulator with XRE-family HTH domain